MSWWPDFTNVKASVFTEAIKKKACGFLLRRYGGNWLKEKAINLDQLTLDLYNGRAKFRNFELDVANINELLDGYSLPLEVVDCFVGSLDIFVPWAAIFCENSHLEIQNLEITLRHRARDIKESSLFDSMLYSSMTTSMKLAEECLKNENSEDKKSSSTSMPYYEGLHDLACTVEAIFVKVKGTLIDSTICFEHINENYTTIFELKIARVDYYDDEVERTGVVAEEDRMKRGVSEERRGRKMCDLASVRSKNLIFQGVKLYIGIEKESCKSVMGRPSKLNNVDSILIGDFVGRHKLRVSFSQEQEANSVKMLIESQIEGVNMVMCPQVLSFLYRICSDISASIAKDEPADKSITSDDYEKIRKGIEAPTITTGIGGGGRQSFTPSNRDEIFQSMAPSSFTNSGFQSMESSLSSMMSSCSTLSGGAKQRGKVTTRRDKKPEEDRISSTEISLRISFFSFILLHDDATHEGESWHDNLRSLEDKYLRVIRGVPLAGISNSSELIKLRKHFSTVLNRDHFSLMLKQLDMVTLLDNKDNCLRNKSFDLELTVGLADLAEAIVHSNGKGIDFCPWLMFEEGFLVMRDEEMTSIGRPSFKLKIEPLEREEKSLMSRSSSSPFLVTLTTTKCSSELDITVLNRIHSIMAAFSPVSSKQFLQQKDPTQSFLFNNEVEDERREKIAIALCSSCWVCKIRFPKADLTEVSRQKRIGRYLHEDSLLFEIQKLNLKTELILMENEFQDFELYFMSAKGHLMANSESHCLLHVSSNLFVKGQDDGFDWPRIKVRLTSNSNSVLGSGMNFPIKELDPMSASFYPMVAQGNRAPFSSKRRQFKNRELIEPGERIEMISFLDVEGNNSSINIDANLQQVLLFLPNKNVLELLYNRLLGDMLLWTPMSPANLSFDGTQAPPSLFLEQNLFRSEMRSPSDENVHDNDELDDLMKMETPEKQSRACVSIGIQEGRIVADVMESSQPRRFVLSLTDLAIPFVSSYHGDPLLHYFCMQASSLDLSHTAILDGRNRGAYDIHARMDGRNWKKILQVNRDNLGLERPCSTRDVLSLTMMIKEESNQLVHYKLAVKLRNCSLVHVDTPRDELHWVFQLMELFSLVDYDIPGYQLPQSISELHFSLENCAVEYRPSFFPHHVLVFSESVHITSNAIPEAIGYKLNIWIEDTGLFISCRQTSKRIDLKKDFVCVADINSFDLSFKQLKEFNEKRPQTSLSASINRLHIRTCSDSFVALSQVIIHLANMGEFMQQASAGSNPAEEPQDVPVVMTEVKQIEVNKLLEDAINSEFTCRTDSPDLQMHRTLVSKFDDRPVAYVFNSPLVSSQESLSSSFSDGSQDNKSGEDANVTRNKRPSQDHGGIAEKLNYIDNHFAKPAARSSAFESEDYPVPLEKYQLTDTSITWHIYGGNDFSPDSTDRRSSHKQKSRKWQEVCGQGRNHSVLVELQLNKVQLLHEVYPDGKRDLSRDVLFVREIEVLDKLEVSDINKFLHLYLSEVLPKPINGNMIKISAHYVRPEESKDRKECMLRISLQPVKLNIDQDTLTFLTNFFTEVSNTAHKTFLPSTPKMSSDFDEEGEKAVEMSPKKETGASYVPIFFSSVRFSPDVVIKIDYKGKRVEQGTLVGLLVGLTQLNQSQITLKKISYKRGLLGVDKVAEYMFNEWVKDIRTNQLSGLLRGVGPMNSFFQFVQGVRDLFWMPVEQYRKDGRIMRGIQRGTYSFASCTAISALELTNKLFNTILFIAEAAHDIVSPSTNAVLERKRVANKRQQRQPKQPEDLREGVTMACGVVREGLHNRATELMDVVAKEHEQRGVTGAIGEMIRQIPPTVIEPIIVASKATSNVLGGVRNQLMPDMRKEDLDKWKTK